MMAIDYSRPDPVGEFRDVLGDAGLLPVEIVPDGKLRRCGTKDKPNSSNGWHLLFADPLAGAYGNWSTGLSDKWCMTGTALSEEDRKRLRETIRQQKAERKAREKAEQAVAIEKARAYLAALPAATDDNPYLSGKGVKACPGLLADGDDLIVPVMGSDGQPMSYQRIAPTGGKLFSVGCPMAGGWFAIKGDSVTLVICEGLATGLSIHMATGRTTLIAFSAGNLTTVARLARDRYPDREIILCADNDAGTEAKTGHNPGIESAIKAAREVNGLVAIPNQPGDFNDLHQAGRLDAVKTAINAARPVKPKTNTEVSTDWPVPVPLPDGLPAVAPFALELLPETLRPWAADIAERMQCPPDFVDNMVEREPPPTIKRPAIP